MYDTSFSYHVTQHEMHLGATILIPWGLKVSPAFHLVYDAYPLYSASYSSQQVTDTGYYTAFNYTWTTFPFNRTIYTFTRKDTSFINYLASLQVSKDFGIVNVGLSGSWSNLNGLTQKQAGISLSYYPLGNLDLYGTTSLTGFFQGRNKRLLASQVVGAKITRWMWAEAGFYYGDYTGANIFNGSVVYNNSDKIEYRGTASLLFLAGNHLQFSLTYQYFQKQSTQVYYTRSTDTGAAPNTYIQQTKTNPYHTNTIIGGITWKL